MGIVFYTGVTSSEYYSYKALNLFNFEEGTGQYRAAIWAKAWDNFTESPWIGNGTFSYSYLNPEDAVDDNPAGNAWISNLMFLTANDTGICGLTVLLSFIWTVLRTARAKPRGLSTISYEKEMQTFEAAFWCLLVAYMATSAFSLGYTWILVALISLGAEFIDSDARISHREGQAIT
jgi:hypothetical protein